MIQSTYRHKTKPQWRFPSLESFLQTIPPYLRHANYSAELTVARNGCTAHVPTAQAFLAHFEASIASEAPCHSSSVAGGICNVPAFLSGEVECFSSRTMQRTPSSFTPIRIFTSMVVGCEFNSLIRRGIAILALAMKLAETRPVELWTFNEGAENYNGDYFTCAIKASSPFCLSELCYLLTSENFARKLNYSLEFAEIGHLSVCPSDLIRRELGLNENDILIPRVWSNDIGDDAVLWVKQMLEIHNAM